MDNTWLAPEALAIAIDAYLAGHGPEWGDGPPWPQTIAVHAADLIAFHAAAEALVAETLRLRRIEATARTFYDRHFAQTGVVWLAGTSGARLRDALTEVVNDAEYDEDAEDRRARARGAEDGCTSWSTTPG